MKDPLTATICVLASLVMAPQTRAQIVTPITQFPQHPSCDVNLTSPLQVVVGTWVYSTSGPTQAAAGRFVATVGTDKAGNPLGLLAVTETFNGQLATFSGKYLVFPDCSGGELLFSGPNPRQFEFFLTPGTDEMRLANNGAGAVFSGTARGGPGGITSEIGCLCKGVESGCLVLVTSGGDVFNVSSLSINPATLGQFITISDPSNPAFGKMCYRFLIGVTGTLNPSEATTCLQGTPIDSPTWKTTSFTKCKDLDP